MSGMFRSSVGRKIAMALSALFLMLFLLQHLIINMSSVFSPETFNQWSHFMGTNLLVQLLLQPVLIFAVIFHFVMGFVLEVKNRKARGNVSYSSNRPAANSSWVSRNMIYTGLVVLFFLGLHFYDFWVPEMKIKYIDGAGEDASRYYPELVHKFESIVRVLIYILAFVFLALHLQHGFSSAFQSMGYRNKYATALKKAGNFYAVLVPLGFIFIALYHHFNH